LYQAPLFLSDFCFFLRLILLIVSPPTPFPFDLILARARGSRDVYFFPSQSFSFPLSLSLTSESKLKFFGPPLLLGLPPTIYCTTTHSLLPPLGLVGIPFQTSLWPPKISFSFSAIPTLQTVQVLKLSPVTSFFFFHPFPRVGRKRSPFTFSPTVGLVHATHFLPGPSRCHFFLHPCFCTFLFSLHVRPHLLSPPEYISLSLLFPKNAGSYCRHFRFLLGNRPMPRTYLFFPPGRTLQPTKQKTPHQNTPPATSHPLAETPKSFLEVTFDLLFPRVDRRLIS